MKRSVKNEKSRAFQIAEFPGPMVLPGKGISANFDKLFGGAAPLRHG
jgi:hypothetical protein